MLQQTFVPSGQQGSNKGRGQSIEKEREITYALVFLRASLNENPL